MDPSAFERIVLDALLAGDSPVLGALRQQLAAATCGRRELTGVGFFCDFSVPSTVPRAAVGSVQITDVHAEIPGLAHGIGFILFVNEGTLEMLEGYTYDEPWPATIDPATVRLRYGPQPRELPF